MSVSKVKELFLAATNAKVVVGAGDDEFLKAKLREADQLARNLTDKIWPYIPSYRLAHFLFRTAKNDSEFYEIIELLGHAAKSGSSYISLNASLLKFSALNRLKLLGVAVPPGEQLACVEAIIAKVSEVNEEDRHLNKVNEEDRHLNKWNKPVQSDYFNILEYLVYATAFDYKPLIGAGRDDRNTLFPHFSNDVWTIIGPQGPLDEFSYNYSDGFAELKRLCESDGVSAYYVLGEPYETLISNSLGEKKTHFRPIKLLNKIMNATYFGAQPSELADIWSDTNTPSDNASKSRKAIEEFLGGNVFKYDPKKNRQLIREDVPLYGLVKRSHRT